REYGKMGKSLKNVVTPDDMCAQYGADTFRVYEMSMGPLDVSRPWETRAVVGSLRFLQRLWRLVVDEHTGAVRVGDTEPDEQTRRLLHRTIQGVRADMENLRFNTAIAKLIELTNRLTATSPPGTPTPREVVEPLVLMVSPFAPHLGEELWQKLGHDGSLAYVEFPTADPAWLAVEQVTGPVRGGARRVRGPGTQGGAGRGGRVPGWPGAPQGDRGPRPHGQRGRLRPPAGSPPPAAPPGPQAEGNPDAGALADRRAFDGHQVTVHRQFRDELVVAGRQPGEHA